MRRFKYGSWKMMRVENERLEKKRVRVWDDSKEIPCTMMLVTM